MAEKKKCYAHLKDKKGEPEIFSLVSITSLASKIMEQILLEVFLVMSKGQKEEAVNTEIINVRVCLASVSSFYDEITNAVDVENAVDIIYLLFSKTFDYSMVCS